MSIPEGVVGWAASRCCCADLIAVRGVPATPPVYLRASRDQGGEEGRMKLCRWKSKVGADAVRSVLVL
jgi:hypothetical protein